MIRMSKNKRSTPGYWRKILESQKNFGIVAAIFVILIPALYWNSLDVPFLYDDNQNIEINTTIRLTELSFEQLSHCWNSILFTVF